MRLEQISGAKNKHSDEFAVAAVIIIAGISAKGKLNKKKR